MRFVWPLRLATAFAVAASVLLPTEVLLASGTVELTVLNPAAVIDAPHELAPRPATLDGKTVALWLSSDDPLYGHGKAVLEAIGEALRQRYPGVRIIPPEQLPVTYKPEDDVLTAILANDPDAVIGGVGG